ncbi:hypothetical protein EZ456_04130 [Pedobacter psychrodurus]|uniref:Uncharacterized protein n=1 Tax=Pedobacter psychrodurus TaxID=2530456 RepID=A0A4R0Q6U6_9SPHI|nr:S41 family peptidase [Pedobacter psychrodurus]TCD28585.1 hypothetical protein EZ456_04130 [Pedobacter psychrodurus]
MDDMIAGLNDRKAIIIDIRINGGGSPEFVNTVMSRLLSEKLVASYGQKKIGSGANDFTPLQEYFYILNKKIM